MKGTEVGLSELSGTRLLSELATRIRDPTSRRVGSSARGYLIRSHWLSELSFSVVGGRAVFNAPSTDLNIRGAVATTIFE